MMQHTIITIGRQFGSGGHEVGNQLSERLNIPLYDHNLIRMAAQELGISSEDATKVDETVLGRFLSAYAANSLEYRAFVTSDESGKPLTDRVYEQQTAYISLREAVDIYAEERMDLSAETQLESASAVLEERLADFLDFVTAVKPAEVVAEPVAVEYYDLDGKRAGLQREGMVIVKARYADGTVRTWKQARKSGR